jgi:lauroyl/myristoyl acyltransferase
LPGLAQLGTLVAVGVALSAVVMIFAYLPPLFPARRAPRPPGDLPASDTPLRAGPARIAPGTAGNLPARAGWPLNRARMTAIFGLTALIVLLCAGVLLSGLPKMDHTADALKPRDSQAYATLDAIKENLAGKREPLWVVIAGRNESEVARRLDAVDLALKEAVARHEIEGYTLPSAIWPRPEFQSANGATARRLGARRAVLRAAALTNGFSEEALGLTGGILDTWERAAATTNVFWPDNPLCRWVFEKLSSREGGELFAAGFIYPPKDQTVGAADFSALQARLPLEGVWLSGWELLGGALLGVVKGNLWKLVLPMAGLVLLSLAVAFRRVAEVLFSAAVLLLSGLCLLTIMRLLGWSWNLLNLMALPLVLGTGVDYTIFMQLALRRHGGDLREAHRSVGRALLLCGGTAAAGFGSLALSSNAGMAGLGRVCAAGIGANTLASVFLLPVWWKALEERRAGGALAGPEAPSSLYRAWPWRLGLAAAGWLPARVCLTAGRMAGFLYGRLAGRRREIVVQNLLPVVGGDRRAAERAATALFQEFTLKLIRLWRYENGADMDDSAEEWIGWERFAVARERGRGVLLVTPHLGNWEVGGAFLAKRGVKLLVLTQPEPDARLTELRRNSRARLGVETLVVGEDAFAFVEIIKRLQEGATVALLVDRPPAPTAVTVELFGRPFQASVAAAELARASGCAVLPVFVARRDGGYHAEVLPEIAYERAALGNRRARVGFTAEILRAFEPVIRQYPTQWYHFVPVWPAAAPEAK